MHVLRGRSLKNESKHNSALAPREAKLLGHDDGKSSLV